MRHQRETNGIYINCICDRLYTNYCVRFYIFQNSKGIENEHCSFLLNQSIPLQKQNETAGSIYKRYVYE